jgi:hypothetical protein
MHGNPTRQAQRKRPRYGESEGPPDSLMFVTTNAHGLTSD